MKPDPKTQAEISKNLEYQNLYFNYNSPFKFLRTEPKTKDEYAYLIKRKEEDLLNYQKRIPELQGKIASGFSPFGANDVKSYRARCRVEIASCRKNIISLKAEIKELKEKMKALKE